MLCSAKCMASLHCSFIMKYDTIPYLLKFASYRYCIGQMRTMQCFSSCYFERTLYLYYHKVFCADYISRSIKICAPSAAQILVLRKF
jgi:hypothetical protein